MTTDKQIEAQIQAKGKTAPRITPADIEASIASEYYFTAIEGVAGAAHVIHNPIARSPLDLLTFCVLLLHNGFTVTGESACASPENFDAEIGRQIARSNAIQKIWPLLGYELRTKLAAPAEAVLNDVRIVPTAGATPTPNPVADLPPIDPAALWKPRIGKQVMVKGYIANGTDEHPGLITRVHGAGQGAFANVTAFPDLQSPKIFSSIPVYSSRADADADIPGATRRRSGFAYLLDQE